MLIGQGTILIELWSTSPKRSLQYREDLSCKDKLRKFSNLASEDWMNRRRRCPASDSDSGHAYLLDLCWEVVGVLCWLSHMILRLGDCVTSYTLQAPIP